MAETPEEKKLSEVSAKLSQINQTEGVELGNIKALTKTLVDQGKATLMQQEAVAAQETEARKEAARARIPASKIIGVTWSCSELDTIPAGKAAIGYTCASMINPGINYRVFQDIIQYVHDAGNGTGPIEEMKHQQLYRVGVLMGIVTVEAITKATEKFGNKPMSGEEVRWGIENMNMDDARLEKMGIKDFIPNFSVTCADHEGSAPVKFQRWNGKSFEPASEWVTTDQNIVRPLIEASAAGYAKDKNITLSCN